MPQRLWMNRKTDKHLIGGNATNCFNVMSSTEDVVNFAKTFKCKCSIRDWKGSVQLRKLTIESEDTNFFLSKNKISKEQFLLKQGMSEML